RRRGRPLLDVQDLRRVQGRLREALPPAQARGERVEREAHGRGARHAALAPLQEDRALRPEVGPAGGVASVPPGSRSPERDAGSPDEDRFAGEGRSRPSGPSSDLLSYCRTYSYDSIDPASAARGLRTGGGPR